MSNLLHKDSLYVQKVDFFPSGSLSSYQPSIVCSEYDEEFHIEDQLEHPQLTAEKIIQYEQNSMKHLSDSHEDILKTTDSKILQELNSLKQELKTAHMQLIKSPSEQDLKQKLNSALKENKELKEDLLVYGSRLTSIEKVLKEAKKNLKDAEEQKSFFQSQLKTLCFKVLTVRNSEKVKISTKDLLEDEFYLKVFVKIENLAKVKTIKQSITIPSPASALSPFKETQEFLVKVNQSLQTEPNLEEFQQKYWNVRSLEGSFLRAKKDFEEDSLRKSAKEESLKRNVKEDSVKKSEDLKIGEDFENFSYRNVFKDLKEINSMSVKGVGKFDFSKRSVDFKSFVDSKLGARK